MYNYLHTYVKVCVCVCDDGVDIVLHQNIIYFIIIQKCNTNGIVCSVGGSFTREIYSILENIFMLLKTTIKLCNFH